jgi:hypothetical protein
VTRFFTNRDLKWTPANGEICTAPRWTDVDLPPVIAVRALKLGAAAKWMTRSGANQAQRGSPNNSSQKSPTVLIWIMMPPWSVIRASPRQFFLQSLIAARRDWALELY